jgi:hypothetical protein
MKTNSKENDVKRNRPQPVLAMNIIDLHKP